MVIQWDGYSVENTNYSIKNANLAQYKLCVLFQWQNNLYGTLGVDKTTDTRDVDISFFLFYVRKFFFSETQTFIISVVSFRLVKAVFCKKVTQLH